ncbi:hypothetical protein MMC14_004995 [Varicellaria rhodocarpa]|nr:hypothetical protein [Varicellaria rhodocarpa]
MVSRDSIPAVINSVPKIVPTSANLEKVVSSSKIPSLSKGQNLRINPEVHQLRTEVARLTPPVGQFIISTVLNVLGFAAAIAFGVFAVRSVSLAIASNNAASRANDLASVANDQSIVANRVALISYCSSTKDDSEACIQIMQNVASILPSVVTMLGFAPATSATTGISATSSTVAASSPPSSSTSTSPTATSSPPMNSISTGSLVGTILGGIIGAIVLIFLAYVYCFRRRRAKRSIYAAAESVLPEVATADEERRERNAFKESMGLRFRRFFLDSTVIQESRTYDND